MQRYLSKPSLLVLSFLSSISLSSYAGAGWNSDDVAMIKQGQKDDVSINVVRRVQQQMITLIATPLKYTIDLRTQACFVTGDKDIRYTSFPCEKLKQGYPVIAELITWE